MLEEEILESSKYMEKWAEHVDCIANCTLNCKALIF
jgi:hypothetical protein